MQRRLLWLAVAILVVSAGTWSLLVHSSSGAAARVAPPASSRPVAFPTPQEETYAGCPPQGDGGDTQLNLLKNRIDVGYWQAVPITTLVALSWPRAIERAPRATWSTADAATVTRTEGRPVVTEGEILKVRHEGPESPNCHDAAARDYHVWLAASASDSRAQALIVELTPRVVARNPGWGGQASLLRLAGQHVRVSGWLMLDQEHPEQLHRTRGTLWEIHPVMKIAVQRGRQWVDLATGKADTGRSPITPPTPRAGNVTPTATPVTGEALGVIVTVHPNPTARETPTTIDATTVVGAQCNVRVVYPSGSRSSSNSLQNIETADAQGRVTWTWTPSTRSTGTATATVRCTLGSRSGTGTASFTVQ